MLKGEPLSTYHETQDIDEVNFANIPTFKGETLSIEGTVLESKTSYTNEAIFEGEVYLIK